MMNRSETDEQSPRAFAFGVQENEGAGLAPSCSPSHGGQDD